MVRFVVAAVVLASPLVAAADELASITIEVDQVVEYDVGYARGFRCDESIVEAEVRPSTTDSNVFVLRGLRTGATTCRVGLEESRPSIVFAITVTESTAPPVRGPKTPPGPPPKNN